MGEEISTKHFQQEDFARFEQRLRQETEMLAQWFADERFLSTPPVGGFELEAWLIDSAGRPAPINEPFLAGMNSEWVSRELATFNIELNTRPRTLHGNVLTDMQRELEQTWAQATAVTHALQADIVATGILPTVRNEDLCLANMSSQIRYRALNEQVLRLRNHKPITLDICGAQQQLHIQRQDLMLEAAATSFQIHMQVGLAQAARLYNTAKILSAPMVAICANSPYLFGRNLWEETRIPLFEQAVSVDVPNHKERVTFGASYVQSSLMECFTANLERYPILLPRVVATPPEKMSHLLLHNGTIWRWNRPLLGFDNQGRPHLRIEHRVVPAGPSLVDTIANAALFFGLAHALSQEDPALETQIPFSTARDNFYQAARFGLKARIVWRQGKEIELPTLLLTQLLPLAHKGLAMLAIADKDIRYYMEIIQQRVKSTQNGAAWQRRYVARHHADPAELLAAYRQRQASGAPVHEWEL